MDKSRPIRHGLGGLKTYTSLRFAHKHIALKNVLLCFCSFLISDFFNLRNSEKQPKIIFSSSFNMLHCGLCSLL